VPRPKLANVIAFLLDAGPQMIRFRPVIRKQDSHSFPVWGFHPERLAELNDHFFRFRYSRMYSRM
jgi:hypothetical protein